MRHGARRPMRWALSIVVASACSSSQQRSATPLASPLTCQEGFERFRRGEYAQALAAFADVRKRTTPCRDEKFWSAVAYSQLNLPESTMAYLRELNGTAEQEHASKQEAFRTVIATWAHDAWIYDLLMAASAGDRDAERKLEETGEFWTNDPETAKEVRKKALAIMFGPRPAPPTVDQELLDKIPS